MARPKSNLASQFEYVGSGPYHEPLGERKGRIWVSRAGSPFIPAIYESALPVKGRLKFSSLALRSSSGHTSPNRAFFPCLPAGRRARLCGFPISRSTPSQYSVVLRSTLVYNSIHSRRSENLRLSFASPCDV